MLRLFKHVIAIAVALSALPLHAAPVLNIDSTTGKLLGASGVLVGSQLLDVSFEDGSCDSLFNGCTSFLVPDAGSRAASFALLEQLFQGRFGDDPALVNGCSSTSACSIVTVNSVLGTTGFGHAAVVRPLGVGVDRVDPIGPDPATDLTLRDFQVYARWSAAQVSNGVPEPGTGLLICPAFLALLACRRIRKPGATVP